MRTKNYLLGFTFIIATSILLILFGDQRPAVQNILTETHKQLKNNLQTFKDNLKEAEEKRLSADEKYLKGLGFIENPHLYPHDIWINTSLPVVISNLFDGDAELGVGLIRNIAHFLPNHTLLLYNLGLGRYDLQLITTYCNSSRCSVVDFYLSDFPSHVSDHKIHAYRPIIIQDGLNHAGAVLYLDNTVRLKTGNIQPLIEKALGGSGQEGSGIVCWATRQAVTSLTHPSMFHYFHTTDEGFLFLPMVESSRLLVYNTASVHKEVMLPWIQCALTHDCIIPIGSQSNGCHFDKKPQYRYSGCHSHASSALNIVLGLAYQFDDSRYTSQQTYFHTVTAVTAAEELARLQDNMTETVSIADS